MRQAGHAAEVRQHNRAHDKWLRKAAAERPTFADQDDARDESYTPELRAARVRDAGGSVRGDNEGGRHFAVGEPEPIEADAKVLTVEQMRVIAGIKARNSRYW